MHSIAQRELRKLKAKGLVTSRDGQRKKKETIHYTN